MTMETGEQISMSVIALEMLTLIQIASTDQGQIDRFKNNYITWLFNRENNPMGMEWNDMCNEAQCYGYNRHQGF